MEHLQQREWFELQSQTWQLLRQRDHVLRSKHTPLFQYLVRPSFTDTWCIDIVRTGEELGIYHTTWRTMRDLGAFSTAMERLRHPRPFVPTLESTQFDSNMVDANSFLTRISGIRLPLKPTKNWISLDGTSFELQIGNGTNGILLQWHNYLPDEWIELVDIVEALNALACNFTKTASQKSDARESPVCREFES